MKFTERDIQNTLYRYLYGRHVRLIVPNSQLLMGCADMLSVSRRNLIHEYEIKCTRGDYFADFKKPKHELLKRRDPHARAGRPLTPSYFSFVVPAGLVQASEVPSYAGLLFIERTSEGDAAFAYVREVRRAPRLHNQPITQGQVAKIATSLMFRYWRLRLNGNGNGCASS